MTEMSLLVLPKMVANNKGVIVNMSSSIWRGAPLVAGYSSTKAYVTIMSQCLSKTYANIAPGMSRKYGKQLPNVHNSYDIRIC